MKSILKPILPIVLITFVGFAQACEPTKDEVSEQEHNSMPHMNMDMKMDEAMHTSESTMEDSTSGESKANNVKHNHREFKGLPSGTGPNDASDDPVSQDNDSADGHDHRKKHK